MHPEPVRRSKYPAYPTREEIREDPDLLLRHLPPGWKLTREFAAATSLFLAAGMAACGSPSDTPKKPQPPGVALVAPIFEHGYGRGATGCVVVSPPVFLSEEEALQVIREELAVHGVEFTESDVELDVEIGAEEDSAPLIADRRDPEKGITVEFVSKADYYPLGGKYSNSTVQSYDLNSLAKGLRERVEESKEGGRYFGTFYDPLESELGWDEETMEPLRPLGPSLDLLRQQVKGFVDWLKAQGAI